MIRRLLAFAPTFVFSAALLPAAPAVPLVNLVDDQTLLAISITDAPALLRGWDASPLAQTWNDEQVSKFVAPLRAEWKIDEWDNETRIATGLTVRELLALAEGEALLAVSAFDVAKFESDDPPPFLIAIEVGGQSDKLRQILADALTKNNLTEELDEFSGVKVHTRPVTKHEAKSENPDLISWAIVDGIWVVSADKQRVFAAIDAVKEGGVGNALGKNERFLRTKERTGDAQFLCYVNFPAIYPMLREGVARAKERQKEAGTYNPLGLDQEVIFSALGLDALGECYTGLRVDEKESRMDFGMVYSEERGLLKLLAYQPGPAPRPDWIPAKWPSVSSARFSLPKAYEALEELVNAINPMVYGMAQGQITSLNRNLRLDLKRDLIGSIGDAMVSAYALPPDAVPGAAKPVTEMDQLFALSLSNEAAFTKSIEALKNLAGPAIDQVLTKRDYLGHALYTFVAPTRVEGQRPFSFSYAIANGTLLMGLGSAAPVENALQGMASNEGLFWKRPEVAEALAEVPADAAGFQVQDMRVMIAAIVEAFVQLQEKTNDQHTLGDRKVYLDVSHRPDTEVIARYWGVSASHMTRSSEGLFSTMRLVNPQK